MASTHKDNAEKKRRYNARKSAEKARHSSTLSPTDIHYIGGFLYLWAGGGAASGTFGAEIFDPWAEVLRDVDLHFFRLRDHLMVGVEVKAHSRPLSLTEVDGLILKLLTTPGLNERAIVSASGFSQGAINKAQKLGVNCLHLIRGMPPKYNTTDYSQLKHMDHEGFRWNRPSFRFNVGGIWHSALSADTRVSPSNDGSAKELTLLEVAENVCQKSAQNWKGPLNRRLTEIISIVDSPIVHLAQGSFPLLEMEVTGVVTPFKGRTPIKEVRYLADSSGKPFAHLVLFDVAGTLMGLGSAEDDFRIKFLNLPPELRSVRPKNVRLPQISGASP